MTNRYLAALSALGLAVFSGAIGAAPTIPENSGWSGYVNIGAGVGTVESNMVAAVASVDFNDERLGSLADGPGDEDVTVPAAGLEIAYTLADMRTQLYFGNSASDFLRFDLDTTLESKFGLRQELPRLGQVEVAYGFSPLATDVWEDPYIVGGKRRDTERTSNGLHIDWSGMFDTPLSLSWSDRQIEIDEEKSGAKGGLGLSDAEQLLLRRTGTLRRLELGYDWDLGDGQRLAPSLGYLDYDLDGDAMAQDGYLLGLQYSYAHGQWRFITDLEYRDLESGAVNPIYGEESDGETLGASIAAFYARPFGWDNWTANGGISYFDADNSIDFYDSSMALVSIGMMYRFD